MAEDRARLRPDGGERRIESGDRVAVVGTRTENGPIGVARTARDVHDPHDSRDVEIPQAYNIAQDRVRWGPIVAGLLTALTALLALSLLGLAIGLTTVDAGNAAAQGGPPPETGRNSAIWGAVSALLAFLLGGYVAGRTAAVFDRGWGALNGALVFLLGVPVALWLASQGMGAVLGSLGGLASGLNADPGQVQGAADQARQATQNVQPAEVARAAERARNAAWGGLAGTLLGLGASSLGGFLGTRREVEVDRRSANVKD